MNDTNSSSPKRFIAEYNHEIQVTRVRLLQKRCCSRPATSAVQWSNATSRGPPAFAVHCQALLSISILKVILFRMFMRVWPGQRRNKDRPLSVRPTWKGALAGKTSSRHYRLNQLNTTRLHQASVQLTQLPKKLIPQLCRGRM